MSESNSLSLEKILAPIAEFRKIPEEPLKVGEKKIVRKSCHSKHRIDPRARLFEISSQFLMGSLLQNIDGDAFCVVISVHPCICQDTDIGLVKDCVIQADWYLEIYYTPDGNSLNERQYYYLLKRQTWPFGDWYVTSSNFAADPKFSLNRHLQIICADIYLEVERNLDRISVGDTLSFKHVDEIVKRNIRKSEYLTQITKFNGKI